MALGNRHRLRNFLHSGLLIGGMMALSVGLGWLLAGPAGVVLLGFTGAVLLALGPRISPALILRMYQARRLTPRHAPRLLETVAELSRRAGLERPPAVYYVPSRMVNAFTVGQRGEAVIGVTDGLLRSMDLRGLTAILAHEIAHVRHNDGWVLGLADFVTRIVGALSWAGQFILFVNLPLLLLGYVTVSWAFILLLIFAPTLSALLQLALSRSREFEADLGAVELTGDPGGLARALARLERLRGGFFERVFFPGRRIPEPSLLRTHPGTDERIARLRKLEEEAAARAGRALIEERTLPDLDLLPEAVGRPPRWHMGGLWH